MSAQATAPGSLTANQFIERLVPMQSPGKADDYRRAFNAGPGQYAESDQILGVRMGDVFALAKEFVGMAPAEIERLLESPIHEARAGALSIMDKQARSRKTSPERRKELFDIYLRRIDRIDNWDLVDLAAPFVIGGYLFDKSRDNLFDLARDVNPWARRTAITATAYFIRQGDVDGTFEVAELLANDDHDLVQKAVGGWLREAGKTDPDRLRAFLERHAGRMPRTMLRYAIEKFEPDERKTWLACR